MGKARAKLQIPCFQCVSKPGRHGEWLSLSAVVPFGQRKGFASSGKWPGTILGKVQFWIYEL
jgi:hypothetical protein